MKFRNWFQIFLVIGSIVPAVAVDGVWIDTASSNVWSDASNWEVGSFPDRKRATRPICRASFRMER